MDNPAEISPLDIMRWPGVLKDQDVESEHLQAAAIETFKATVAQLLDGRQREGDKLADMIEQRLVGIQEQTAIVRENLPDILAHQRARLEEKMVDMKIQLDEGRLEQEIVIIDNRSDVDEELDRLEGAHYRKSSCPAELRLNWSQARFFNARIESRSQHSWLQIYRRCDNSGVSGTKSSH